MTWHGGNHIGLLQQSILRVPKTKELASFWRPEVSSDVVYRQWLRGGCYYVNLEDNTPTVCYKCLHYKHLLNNRST